MRPRSLHPALLIVALVAAAGCSGTGSGSFRKAPEHWDGLQRVDAKRLDLVYLLPDADFRPYNQVILDPVSVEFDRNWLRNQNSNIDLSRRVDAEDVQRIRSGLGEMVVKRFGEELSRNGYALTEAPSDSTLRISAAITDLYVNAPDVPSAGRVRTYTTSAGSMTLVVEARDSVTGKLLARAVDHADDADASTQLTWTNSVTNAADADLVIRNWARRLRQGLDTLTGRDGGSR